VSMMLILLFSVTSFAQKRSLKVVKNNRGQKAVVVNRNKGNKVAVIKTNKGNTVAIKKTNTVSRSLNNSATSTNRVIVTPKRVRAVNYRYVALPKRGSIVARVHRNASLYRFRGVSYRFYNGVWFKPYRNQWIVVRPSLGFTLNVLPIGYRVLNVMNTEYYYYYGSFYCKRGSTYVVVNAPLGAEVISLPTGYTTQVISGVSFYQLDGVYYKSKINFKGEEVIVVIKNPRISIT